MGRVGLNSPAPPPLLHGHSAGGKRSPLETLKGDLETLTILTIPSLHTREADRLPPHTRDTRTAMLHSPTSHQLEPAKGHTQLWLMAH